MQELIVVCSSENKAHTKGKWSKCRCGQRVWLSDSSLKNIRKNIRKKIKEGDLLVLCESCGFFELSKEKIPIIPPSREQLHEIMIKNLNQHN